MAALAKHDVSDEIVTSALRNVNQPGRGYLF